MFSRAVLQQRKTEDQAAGPQREQEKQRKRPKVAKKVFAATRRLDQACNLVPRFPGITVEPHCDTKFPPHPARQDNRFKRVQQDCEDNGDTGDGGENKHSRVSVAKMVADSESTGPFARPWGNQKRRVQACVKLVRPSGLGSSSGYGLERAA